MAKSKLALGLDIGSSSVKLVQLREGKRGTPTACGSAENTSAPSAYPPSAAASSPRMTISTVVAARVRSRSSVMASGKTTSPATPA